MTVVSWFVSCLDSCPQPDTVDLCLADATLRLLVEADEEAAALGHKVLVLSQPPNQTPTVIANPGAGQPDYTQTETYSQVCVRLRNELEQRQ